MALALETTIMDQIGLGGSLGYNYFNGSGSCQYIREEAARRMSKVIQEHVDAGEKIVAPDSGLMSLMRQATTWDEDQYILTKAWQVASYIIAAHIHAASFPKEEQHAYLRDQEKQIRQIYQPARGKRDMWDVYDRRSRRPMEDWELDDEIYTDRR